MVETIPLYPLCGAILMLLAGRALERMRRAINLICCGSIAASLATAVQAVMAHPDPIRVVLFTWMPRFGADCAFVLDHLSAVMVLIVTGIGLLIHIYSIGYMAQDGGYYRFFGYLNLFIFFMLLLVLADNFVLMFVGWEGVGLASYLLIGFYFQRASATKAAMKAFLINRVGDAGFLMGVFAVWTTFGTTRFSELHAPVGLAAATGLLLFVGAMGKSAQFPLHVWLPDAMEGPTPVSALIHAATMVTAGVYMIARVRVLFAPQALEAVAIIGAFTAILAASNALVQNDIKRVLAYSTVSQLGYMFLALGVGAYWVAIFHLMTHAFFKALLFLGAGSVIHGLHGDLPHMGGLRKSMPITHATMLVGALAISGIPGFAGFFSKDEILDQVLAHGGAALYAVGIVTALMTSFYMWRLMYLAFYGKPRIEAHPHESPLVMTVPLCVLALGSLVAGWPKHWFEEYLAPVTGHTDAASSILLTLVSVAVAIAGIGLARVLSLRHWSGAVYHALLNKWHLDEIYDFLFVRGLVLGGGELMNRFDARVVDGGVNGAGWLTRAWSRLSIWWDIWIVDGLVNLVGAGVRFLSFPVRFVQSGQVQTYALVFVIGVLTVFGYYLVR